MKRRLAALTALAAFVLVAVPSALAATITVTTLDDELNADGDCSLREAVAAANGDTAVDACPAGSGSDVITFGVAGTIQLGFAGQLTIMDNLTINGPGAGALTIRGNGFDAGRVMEVALDVQATISGVTIAHGRWISAPTVAGAGILNHGNLAVANAVFLENDAGGGCCSGLPGGAIGSDGTLTVLSSTFVGNSAGGEGGAIYSTGGPLTVAGSVFEGNHSNNWGGGIFNGVGRLRIADTTFNRNSAVFGGGGLTIMSAEGSVASSTFSRNTTSSASGGGIFNHDAVLTIANATLWENAAPIAGGGLLNSGGAGSVLVENATFARNAAPTGGGIQNSGGAVALQDSIVADSTAGGNCSGAVVDGGGNLSWPDLSCPGLNQDPLLDPAGPQPNGGSTESIALMPASPAIDFALACPPPAADQRGVLRPQGAACDSGSYEREAAVVRVPQHYQSYDVNQPERVTETVTLVDQFGTRTVRLEEIEWLLNPVEKRRAGRPVTPIERPGEHYTCYGMGYLPSANRTVHVRNQFVGDSTLRTGRPLALCTPAAKSLTATPGLPVDTGMDHYECYDVTSETPTFHSETLELQDQFGTRTVRIDRARELCNPVEKRRTGQAPEPVLRPDEHYVCYRIVSHTPAFSALNVFTRDQFGPATFRVVSPRRLCVPSEKFEGPPPS